MLIWNVTGDCLLWPFRVTSTVIRLAPVTVAETPAVEVIVGLGVISHRRVNVDPAPTGSATPQFAGVPTHPVLVWTMEVVTSAPLTSTWVWVSESAFPASDTVIWSQ